MRNDARDNRLSMMLIASYANLSGDPQVDLPILLLSTLFCVI